MAEATKCDRCGDFFEGRAYSRASIYIDRSVNHYAIAKDGEIDRQLCESCTVHIWTKLYENPPRDAPG